MADAASVSEGCPPTSIADVADFGRGQNRIRRHLNGNSSCYFPRLMPQRRGIRTQFNHIVVDLLAAA
jgi:hypothetical protein